MGLGIKRREKVEYHDSLEVRTSIILKNQPPNTTLTRIPKPTPRRIKGENKTPMKPDTVNLKQALALSQDP